MTRDEAYQKIIEFCEDNEEAFIELIEELDAWNGYLGYERYYPMEDVDDFCIGMTPSEILMRAFFGFDEDTWIGEGDRRRHGEFNPNREYFRYDGYANFVSSDYKDYSSFLDRWFVDELIENKEHLRLPVEVKEVISLLEDEQ